MEAEPSHIGEESGPVFAQNSGRANTDKDNPLRVPKHRKSMFEVFLKFIGIGIGDKISENDLSCVFQSDSLFVQMFPVTQFKFAVTRTAQLLAEAQNRAGGNVSLIGQIFDFHAG